MHQKEIYIIIYKRILQTLHGLNKNYLYYGKFRKGIYILKFIDYHNLQIIHHQIMRYMG
ncbi:hypothetical protein C1645_768366 [Glomus cerebriforme]|uniref:Uncharacterized protein n=1 Tax=Glomus cerebriforme TaxID=658196 RepID=A0A397SY17_9GLOM|nr:hypothetical protein C1645_768366 [Glomus cerebriforme]